MHTGRVMEGVLDRMEASGHVLGAKELALARAIVEAIAAELMAPVPGESEHLYEQVRRGWR